MISGVEGRGLESWGHLGLQGQRRLIVMRPTFPTHNPSGFTPTPLPPPFISSSAVTISSPSPTVLCLLQSLFGRSLCFFVVVFLSFSVVNPITIYDFLLPLAKHATMSVVVEARLEFCDKQRFLSCLFILF